MRTPETMAAYTKAQEEGLLLNGCPICKAESLKEFTLWRIITNKFPYDKIAAVHHMLVPKRHVPEAELSPEEKEEYKVLKNSYIDDTYQFIMEPTTTMRSIPAHAHLHLVVLKT